ncbi:hypothetical protein [Undibacterium sp. Ji22W]|uniref:hypothetical protein n=1 Tax=Undibacterium sp. Ji22W TaxID=3413038 RepID=UPI003BF43497
MYLIAIAWIYVVLLMSLAESSLLAGIMTFVFYCIIPLGLVLYILSSPARKRQIKKTERERLDQLRREAGSTQSKSN